MILCPASRQLLLVIFAVFIVSLHDGLTSANQLCNASYYVLHLDCQYNCSKQDTSLGAILCEDDGITVIECNGAKCFSGKCEIFECRPSDNQLPGVCNDKPPAEVTSLCTDVSVDDKRTWTNLLILPIVAVPAIILICLVIRQIRPHIQRHPSLDNETTWAPLKTSSSQQFDFVAPTNGAIPREPSDDLINITDKSLPQIRVVPPSLEDCSVVSYSGYEKFK